MSHKHHIVFRSQGGLDIEMNYHMFQGYEDHEGPGSPHQCREKDLELKTGLQSEYFELFGDKEEYTIEEIAQKLGKSRNYIEKNFRRVQNWCQIYKREDIIRKLMGGKLY